MLSIIRRCCSSSSSRELPQEGALAVAEVNRSKSRLTVTQSWYLVTAQNPGPPGSSCQCTGSCRRRWVSHSYGTPETNERESVRSTGVTSAAVSATFGQLLLQIGQSVRYPRSYVSRSVPSSAGRHRAGRQSVWGGVAGCDFGTTTVDLVGSSGSRTTRSRSSASGGSPGASAEITGSFLFG